MSFDRLAVDNPAALDLITLVAWFGPAPVPLDLLSRVPHLLPERLAQAVEDLLALAQCTQLLHRRAVAAVGPHSIQLHRVPASLLRAQTSDNSTGSWASTVVRVLFANRPPRAWKNPTVWPEWRHLLPHVLAAVDSHRDLDEVIDETVWLLSDVSDFMLSYGDPGAALPLSERACALGRGLLDADDPAMLQLVHCLALVVSDLGEHERSRNLNEDTLTRRRHVLGDDHPATLWSANNLALDLHLLGHHQQAWDLHKDTYARRRRVLGDDDRATLVSASNVAAGLRVLGEHQQARELDQDTLTRRRQTLGHNHPDTLWSANNLARDLCALGEYQQAHDLDQDTLTRRQQSLGHNHPDTLLSVDNLAADLQALGEHEQAQTLLAQSESRRTSSAPTVDNI